MSIAAGESKGDRGEGDKDSAAARSVLQSTQGAEMGLVHSNRSVTAMIKSSRDKQLGDTFQNQGSTVLNHVCFFYYIAFTCGSVCVRVCERVSESVSE